MLEGLCILLTVHIMYLNQNQGVVEIMAVAFTCISKLHQSLIEPVYRDGNKGRALVFGENVQFIGCGDMLILVSGDKCALWSPANLDRKPASFRLAGPRCNGIYQSEGYFSYSLAPDNECYTFEVGENDDDASRQWYHGKARLPISSTNGSQVSSTNSKIYRLLSGGEFGEIGNEYTFPGPEDIPRLTDEVLTIGRTDVGWINNMIFPHSYYGGRATHEKNVIFACTCSYVGKRREDPNVVYFVDEDTKLYTIEQDYDGDKIVPYENERSVVGWVAGWSGELDYDVTYYPVLDDGYIPWLDMTIAEPFKLNYSKCPYYQYLAKSQSRRRAGR